MEKSGGTAALLATTSELCEHLTLDGSSVYFTTLGKEITDQRIVSVKKTGGPLVPIVLFGHYPWNSTDVLNANGLAVFGDEIYWSNGCDGCALSSTAKTGGAIRSHVSVTDGIAEAITVSGADLYFTTRDNRAFRMPRATRGATLPAAPSTHAGTSSTIALDAQYMYWVRRAVPYETKTDVLVRQAR